MTQKWVPSFSTALRPLDSLNGSANIFTNPAWLKSLHDM
jgi:hypothetical protein